jgi:hypothetical protein
MYVVPKIPLSKLTHLNKPAVMMMFGKEFLHQVCLFATIFFPYLPIEIKETSVIHVFVFLKEERWFAKKMK